MEEQTQLKLIQLTTFEKLGIEYKEYDGLLYPVLSVSEEAGKPIHIGKYGRNVD